MPWPAVAGLALMDSDFKASPCPSPSAASTGLSDESTELPEALPAASATLRRAKALSRLAVEEAQSAQRGRPHVQRLREQCEKAKSRVRRQVGSVHRASEVARSLEGYEVHYEDAKSRVRHAKSAGQQDLRVCQRRLEILQELEMEGKKSRRALLEALQFEEDGTWSKTSSGRNVPRF